MDDESLQALPGTVPPTRAPTCTLHGADISLLLALGVTNASVLTVDHLPSDRRGLPGTAQACKKDAAVQRDGERLPRSWHHAALRCVVSVEWAAVGSANGLFLPFASQTFTSETSRGWVYVSATLMTAARSRSRGLTASVAAPRTRARRGLRRAPPRVSVLARRRSARRSR